MKFRKKPVEAVQYAGAGNMNPRGGPTDWFWTALETGIARFVNGTDPLLLKTVEGDLTVSPGDWIIRDVKGELYPCKPDIFALTYEPALPSPPVADSPIATEGELAMARGFVSLWDSIDVQDADDWLYVLRNRAEVLLSAPSDPAAAPKEND